MDTGVQAGRVVPRTEGTMGRLRGANPRHCMDLERGVGGRGDAEHREREAPGSLDKEEGGGSNQDQAQGQL